MHRTLLCSAIALAILTGAADAATFTDTYKTFRLVVPDGWESREELLSPTPIKFEAHSPRAPETGGNCNVVTMTVASLNGMTQRQIDALVEPDMNEAFWQGVFAATGKFKSTKIDKWGSKSRDGRNVYSVKASSDAVLNGKELSVVQLQDMIAVPGRMYAVTCTANAEGFRREEDDFASIMGSFEPLVDTPVAALTAGSAPVLTLYARTGLSGASRVVTRDAPDLAFFGWNGETASVGVRGAAAWELCSEAQYRGRCRAVSGDVQALPGGVSVGSARQLPVRGGTARIAATLGSDAAAAGAGGVR